MPKGNIPELDEWPDNALERLKRSHVEQLKNLENSDSPEFAFHSIGTTHSQHSGQMLGEIREVQEKRNRKS